LFLLSQHAGGQSDGENEDDEDVDVDEEEEEEEEEQDRKPKKGGKKARGRRSSSNTSSQANKRAKTGNGDEVEDERRKNFLERNRQAALKCRQRKKQWLQSLQQKVEFYAHEHEQLTAEIQDLRGELLQLKQVLHSHRDCPSMRAHGLTEQLTRDLESAGMLKGGMQNKHHQMPMQVMSGVTVGGGGGYQ